MKTLTPCCCAFVVSFVVASAFADPAQKVAVVTNRAAIRGTAAMAVLKPGAVRPEGFLREQLSLQARGLTGHAEELYHDIGKSAWLVRTSGDPWERGPYYARGLLALAYELDDAALRAKAARWAEAYLASQRANGDIGPIDGNWWANMLVLHFLRDWQEITGDERVVPFLEKYFRFQKTAFAKKPIGKDSCWAACRGGDELDVVLWLYDRTRNPEWLEFAEIVRGQTCDWSEWYADPKRTDVFSSGGKWWAYQTHGVNLNQGLKTTALFWRLTGSALHREGWRRATDPNGWLMRRCGRVDGTLNGTEDISSSATTEGIELCAQAERILSDQIVMSVFADAEVGDDMESVAYNLLPSTLHPQIRGTRYYHILNQPACVSNANAKAGYGFACNGEGAAMAPGPEAGYGCCRSNFHMAWPKFIQSMWMAKGNGLAAVAYGPCRVSANGFEIVERTDYPFSDTVSLEISAAPEASAPLSFRVPRWTEGGDIRVNGVSVDGTVPGRFCEISRTWKKGDRVTLTFPASTRVVRGGPGQSAALRNGVLLYAWPVPGKWQAKPGIGDFAKWEILPTAPWNVALVLSDTLPRPKRTEPMPKNPFDPETPALTLTVKGFRTDEGGWGTFAKGSCVKANEPPKSPIAKPTAVSELTLVPLGATQTRITLFPWARP